MLPKRWRVERFKYETRDTFTMSLNPLEDAGPLNCQPGQFNMLYIFGVGEVPISVSGIGPAPHQLTHTTRAVGSVTRAMSQLKTGSVIGVRGPFGNGWPLSEARGRDVVLVAGGIGFAPIRPALLELLENRDEFGRILVYYGARSPEDLLFQSEHRQWMRRGDLDVQITVDKALGDWQGHVGVVTTLIGRASFDSSRAIAFVCGPEVMIRFASLELIKQGLGPDQIHISMERNMKCAIGFCGHCQFGPEFICRNGPVLPYDKMKPLLQIPQV